MGWIENEFGVHDADPLLAERYRQIAASRDADALYRLVVIEHPDVLWGSVTSGLPEEDRKWVLQSAPTQRSEKQP